MQPSSLSVVDTETLEEVARTTTCRMPHGSRVAPNGKHHYSVCMMDDLLVEVDARTAKVSRQLRLTAGTPSCSPTWVQPTVDGKAIWVACNASSEAVIIDPTTWTVRQRVRTPAAPYNMAATPDGSLMILTQKAPGTTTLWRTTDATLVAEIPGTRRIASGVVVSADSRFAFVTLEGRNADPGTVDIIDLATRATVASVNVGKQAGGIAIVP
jgi:DNA-binding beta-propeller fold protein YncE